MVSRPEEINEGAAVIAHTPHHNMSIVFFLVSFCLFSFYTRLLSHQRGAVLRQVGQNYRNVKSQRNYREPDTYSHRVTKGSSPGRNNVELIARNVSRTLLRIMSNGNTGEFHIYF